MRRYRLAGGVGLAVEGGHDVERYVQARMDPFGPVGEAPGAVELVLKATDGPSADPLVDVQRHAGDTLVTASDGRRLHLLAGDPRCTLPDPLRDERPTFAFEPGFPPGAVFKPYLLTALQIAMLRADAVAVHSASVELDGGAVLLAGWSETGKTEVALALMEAGAAFLSDKWTVLEQGGLAAPFPIEVGIRSWVLPCLPRLRASLPPAARLQLRVAGAAAPATRLGERAGTSGGRAGRLVGMAARVASLAERAALSPSEVRAAYGQTDDPVRRVPLRAVVLLTTVPSGEAEARPAEAGWAARRLARSAAYERRPYFSLTERSAYALPDHPRADVPSHVIEAEQALLEQALAGVRLVEVRAPFPSDPRPAAHAIRRFLEDG